jgi:diketogulonate reductase-like aldo/keto reductase
MDRRKFLTAAVFGLGTVFNPLTRLAAAATSPLLKYIPSTGEPIPAIGMGSSITFNVGADPIARRQRTDVLQAFFELGGGMIDSSPMYGSSEAVIGHGLEQLGFPPGLFSATKVWTSSREDGAEEIEASRQLWKVKGFDLLQVHNLLAWEEHLETLFAMKAEGRVRYVGITTSHGRRHRDLVQIMEQYPIDFVQASYNILDREAEEHILPVARERRIAFIANRPFRRGALIDRMKRFPLPNWANEIDCHTWAAFLLKFIISHPDVTCVIPATSRVDHMQENMAALVGSQPDTGMRRRMISYVEEL